MYLLLIRNNIVSNGHKKWEETIEHLFWNCEIVQAFIDEIDSWLWSNGVSIPFNMQLFSFW